jgi:hypothetical protein
MPHDALLNKLEETDPSLIDDVRGYDEFHDLEDNYNNFVRSEIVDWGPDVPFLESDQTRRDPTLSRSILNLRYNGTRGSNPDLPRHPEMFYGFTGNDPRGAGNDPRFDQMRGHMNTRAAGLVTRMGNNDDNHLAESPWTGQSISYGMKELHRRLKDNTKIFNVQKEGRPWGGNVAVDPFAAGDLRAAAMRVADESLNAQDDHERFHGGDHNAADDHTTDGVRGVDAGRRSGADSAPWRNTTGDTTLGVAQYGQKRGGGRTTIGAAAQGGGRLKSSYADQDWAESSRAQSTNRAVLGASMGAAARMRKARARTGKHDQDHGESFEAAAAPGGGMIPARDIAALHRHTVEGQNRRAGEVQDGDGGYVAGSGLAPSADRSRAIRASNVNVTPNNYLTNVGAIVTGLREGTAAGRRLIKSMVIADGARHLTSSELTPEPRRGAIPGKDYSAISRMSDMPMSRAAAAEGLEVHSYRGAPPQLEHRAVAGQYAYDGATWQASREALPIGSSKTPGEWRSHTQDPTVLGDAPDRVFGFDAEVSGFHGAAAMGPKKLRAGAWSNSANLTDDIGGFSEGILSSA